MWVHNCDTDYTSKRAWFSPVELCGEVKGIRPTGLVVLSGGEPFRQNIGPATEDLIRSGYKVQIETNGTLFIPHHVWDLFSTTIVCSPKTPEVVKPLQPFISAYKYVVDHEHIDPHDGLPTQVLGTGPPVARPHQKFRWKIYVQPMDADDEEENRLNTKAAISVCQKHGYYLCLQIQKIIGMK